MTNHNPTITSSAATGSFSETANTTGSSALHLLSGTMNFTDSDHSDTHTTSASLKSAVLSSGSVIPAGSLAHFNTAMTSTIQSDSNGSGKLKWSFSDEDDDFDFLAKNQTLTLTYDIKVSDNHGGTTKQTVTITITGTDDKPMFATSVAATINEQTDHTLSLSPDTAHIAVQFTDADLTNTGHTASVTGVSATGVTTGILPGSFGTAELMGFFHVDNVVKASGSSNGTINTTFSAPDLAFDYLAAGEQLKITYTIQLDDHAGGISTQTVAVTVNGTNDKPVVLAFPESAHLTEDHNLSGGNLTAHGDFLFSDIDLSDTHTVSTTVTATRSGGGTVPISNSDLIDAMGATIDPDSTSQLLGDVNWNFALPNSAVNFLAEGETLTLNYHITVTDPSGASDTEDVCITVLGTNHPVVTISATVPGGTADTPGEVISYSIGVGNAGITAMTGITVTDPTVSDLAPVLSGGFNSGDINHDNKLNPGETWHYTASQTVTQNDLNTGGGGDGFIENTVTADSVETAPVSATTSVVVENGASLTLTKTADVASVDSAGDVINYTVNVTNTGVVQLTSLDVTDTQVNNATPILGDPILGPPLWAQVLNGEFNAGDTNQNGVQDPGETFQYVNAGDTNQNGVQDPGETFLFTNIGDTNQNGFQDTGETFQFYNAGDTNHNGVEDSGETFQFAFDHHATPVDANHDGLNDGDTNHNTVFDPGETWQYTVSYTVTQDDIDNGGVVNPALTHDNTATATTAEGANGSGSVSVSVVQNPHVTLVKSATVADGAADAAGDVINYTINVSNDGNMTLTSPMVSDPAVSNLTLASGDANSNGKIDVGETWHYTASHTVTQSDIDNGGVANPALTYSNTASISTHEGASASGSASVPIVQDPDVTLTKTATVPGGTADTAGEVISYSIDVANAGNMTLTGVSVSDPSVADLAAVMTGGFNSGDTNHDGKLSLGETWHYTASHMVTQGDIDTNGGGDGTIDNTASVTTTQGASDSASAHVTVVQPPAAALTIDDNGNISHLSDPGGDGPSVGDPIQFFFQVTNHTSNTLTSFMVTDTQGDAVPGSLQTPIPSSVGPLGGFNDTFNHFLTATDISTGFVDDDVTATGVDPSSVMQTATLHYHFLLP
jgi:uncharacterized repeat protein (TIGR01451 family)